MTWKKDKLAVRSKMTPPCTTTGEGQEMTTAELTARKMAGDGKTPNKYWVVIGNSWLREVEPHTFDGAEGSQPEQAKTFGPFGTYAEAEHKAEALLNELVSPETDPNGLHTVTIEDRLNGQCFEATYYERRSFCDCGKAKTEAYELEWHKEAWAGTQD